MNEEANRTVLETNDATNYTQEGEAILSPMKARMIDFQGQVQNDASLGAISQDNESFRRQIGVTGPIKVYESRNQIALNSAEVIPKMNRSSLSPDIERRNQQSHLAFAVIDYTSI